MASLPIDRSPAIQELLTALGYDPQRSTVKFSAATPALKWARNSLLSAVRDESIKLHGVQLADGSAETLSLTGRCHGEPAYLEITLDPGTPETLLLLMAQPDEKWYPFKDSPEFPKNLEQLWTQQAVIAISHGLRGVNGERTVGTEIDLSRFDFRNGMQILFDHVVNATGLFSKGGLDAARKAHIPEEDLGFWQRQPSNRAEIQLDAITRQAEAILWWDREPAATAGAVDEVGYAVVYDLGEPQRKPGRRRQPSQRWLRRVGTPTAPVLIEADIVEGYPARYTARLDRGAPLGETEAALAALVPGKVVLPKGAPPSLSLIAFTYAPGEGQYLTVAAGSREADGEHVIALGPFELREVRYTIGAPLAASKGSRAKRSRTEPAQPKPSVEIEGLITLFGEQFDVRGRPGHYIQGGLVDPAGVHLGKLIQQVLPTELPFGLDSVTLRSMWVHLPFGEGDGAKRFEISLDGQVELLPSKALVLDSVNLAIEHDAQGVSGQIQAVLTLGPITLRIGASEEGGAWTFYGSLSSADGISFKDIADHVAHAWGAPVPDPVPDIWLTLLALSFNTQNRMLEIQAEVDWVVDHEVPVLSGKQSALLDFTVAPDRERGGHAMTAEARWTLTKPDAPPSSKTKAGKTKADATHADTYTLDAHARISRDEQSFGFDLMASDPEHPLEFSDVTRGIRLDKDIPESITDALDELLKVSSLSVDYARPGGYLDLAWTRPLGNGLLVSEFHRGGGDTDIEVSWSPNPATKPAPTVGIKDVAKLLDIDLDSIEAALKKVDLGGAFKDVEELLTFRQLGFSWKADGSNEALTVMAHSELLGRAFLYLPAGESKGIVAGLAFDNGSLDKLKFLPDTVHDLIKSAKDLVSVEPALVQISTISSSRLSPPAFDAAALVPSYERPKLGGSHPGALERPFGTGFSRLTEGLTIGARVNFADGSAVRRVVHADHLDAQITISETGASIQAGLPGSVSLDAGGGNSIALGDPYLRVAIGEAGPELDLGGSLDLSIFGHHLQVAGWLSLNPESIEAHLEFTDFELTMPMLWGVHFEATKDKPFYLEFGLQFEPPGLDLGIDGHFSIWTNNKVYQGHVVFVLEIVEEIPEPLYVELDIDQLDLPAILEAVTGLQWALHLADEASEEGTKLKGEAGKLSGDAQGLIHAVEGGIKHIDSILSEVQFDDVRLHFADNIVLLPDGSTALPGLGFKGGLKIFDRTAYAQFDIASGPPAFTGRFEAEAIEFKGVARLTGDGAGVRKQFKGTSVDLVPATGKQAVADSDDWFVPAGGPVLILSTRASPFLHADLHAELLGAFHADVHADITDHGFDFDFHVAAGTTPANHAIVDLECHYWHDEGKFEAHGDLSIHLHGPLGPIIPHISATEIDLDAAFDADFHMQIDREQNFTATIRGSFEYKGATMDVPELTLHQPLGKIEDLVDKVWKHIKDVAHEIFEDVIAPVEKYVGKAAKEVAHVASEAAHEYMKVMGPVSRKAAKIVSEAGAVAEKEAKEIEQKALEVAKQAEATLVSAAKDAQDAAQPLHDRAEKLRHEKGSALEKAVDQVEAIGLDAEADVKTVTVFITDLSHKAADFIAAQARDAAAYVKGLEHDAVAFANEMEKATEKAVQSIEAEISKLAGEIEELANKIEDLVEAAARAAERAAGRAFHSVSHAASAAWHKATSWF